MKKSLVFLVFTLLFGHFLKAAGGYDIKLTIKGAKDTMCTLVYYYGEKNHKKDSARINSKGVVEFKGSEALPGGMYVALLPNGKYFDMIIDKEQKFTMETDTADFVSTMKTKGSLDNELFYAYRNLISLKGKEMEALKKELDASKGNEEHIKEVKAKQAAINKEVEDYQNHLIAQYPDRLVSKLIEAGREPEIPEAPLLANGKKDSTFAFRYFKSHYFDKIDMKDDRMLRTPVFGPKVKMYMEKFTAQVPDSINKAADYVLSLTDPKSEIFKYLVYIITNTAEKSNVMGMDAVFVYMADNYYLSGKAYWVDSTQQEKIKERVNELKPSLIGKTANNIHLLKNDFHPVALNDIKHKFTIVYFWDPSCGHCQKVTPKLAEFYKEKAKEFDLEVLAVYIEADTVEWFKYIREKNLNWINAADLLGKSNFRNYYDIRSTPVIYILDRNKKIIAKRIDVENIEDFLKNYMKYNP